MKLAFWWIGKTSEKYLSQGISIYNNRLKHYASCELMVFKDIKKNCNIEQRIELEGKTILKSIEINDFLVLCDEKGNNPDSIELSRHLEKWLMDSRFKKVIFLVCGAYGASDEVKSRANFTLSLSALTFSHQMVRLFLLEQVYRAFTIIRNEKYHNV